MIYIYENVCRLVKVPGPYVFLSPLAAATLDDDLNIDYALPADLSGSSNKTAVLLLWNAGDGCIIHLSCY